jgi:hypothetical protein
MIEHIDSSRHGSTGLPEITRDRRAWLLAIGIVGISIWAFWPALDNNFVNWDDETNFLLNPYFRETSWTSLSWAWTTYWLGVYQPFAWMLFELEHLIWGLNPMGITSSAWCCTRSTASLCISHPGAGRARRRRSARTSVELHLGSGGRSGHIFAYPLRTEVVAWVSSQPYSPCVMFCLLAILLYLQAHPRHGVVDRLAFCASFVCFVVALLFKAVAVTLPLLLLLLDAYPLRRRDIRLIWLKRSPHFGVSLIFVVLAVLSKPHAPIVASAPLGSFVGRIAHSAYGIGFYLTRTIWPYPLTAFYGASPGARPWNWPFVASFVAAVTITVIAVRLRKSSPSLLAAWIAFVTVLSPNLGLVQIGSQLAADDTTRP